MEYLELRFPGRRMGQRRFIEIEEPLTDDDLKTLSDSIASYLDEKGIDEKETFNVYNFIDAIFSCFIINGNSVHWKQVKFADKPILKTFAI